MEIQHFSHHHPLLRKADESSINQSISCGICGRSNVATPFYSCDRCEYYLHKSCADLPHTLNHSFHPPHPLTLSIRGEYFCDSCHRVFSDGYSFNCVDCNFDIDIECAMMTPIPFTEVGQKNIIEHFSHQHPMPLVQMDNKDEIMCFGCQSSMCSGDRVYGCTKCKYFLHELCATFPKEIRYPFHCDHDVLAFFMKHLGFECTLCTKKYKTAFAFECHECGFQLCAKCSVTRGTFKYDHEHLLCFAEGRNTKHIGHCNIDDSYCKRPVVPICKEFSHTGAFYCLECDFKVHLLCGPLPSMIKYECHVHPLILVDSLVEDNSGEYYCDNSGEYYCDICEKERDSRIRVYYCEECKYIAHVHCLASKVINILTGDLRDVKLMRLGEDTWKLAQEKDIAAAIAEEEQDKSPLTLKNIIDALTYEDKQMLKYFYKWDVALSEVKGQPEKYGHHRTAQSKFGDEDISEILELSRFKKEDLTKFYDELRGFFNNPKNLLELKSSDLELKLVSVKGYKIPHTLAPVLKTILDKYGDVSIQSPRPREYKSIVYFILCQVLKEMCSTTVADITRNLLQEWDFHLTFVKRSLFKINFALAHLERMLIPAFLGVQVNRLEDEIPTIIEDKIAKLEEDLIKERCRLEKCKEYRGSSTKSEFMEDCLNKGFKLKWKNACEGLFTDHQARPDDYELEYWSP